MDLLKDIFLILYGAIINQVIALLFTRKCRKNPKEKTTLQRSTKSKGGSLDK